MLDLLGRLVDKSLVIAETQAEAPRYRMLETIREFAREQLDASGEVMAIRERQRDWCLALVEAPAPAWGGAAQVEWAERLEREHDNLRDALAFCAATGPAGVVSWLRLGAALAPFWHARGHIVEGFNWLERALTAGPAASAAVRAPALAQAGRLAYIRGDFARGAAWLEEALALYRAEGNAAGIAWTLSALAALLELRGERTRVADLLGESLARYREIDDQWGVADTLNKLAFTAFFGGDVALASALCAEALPLYRAHADHEGLAATLLTLARAAMLQRDFPRAEGLYIEALALSRAAAEKKSLPNVLVEAGMLQARLGHHARAAAYQRESLALNRARGSYYGIYSALGALGSTLIGLGQPEQATRLVAAGERLREAIGATRPAAYAPLHERLLATLRRQLGEYEFATLWAEGEALPLERAIAEALDEA